MSIEAEITRIREEQARASDREWRVCSPQDKSNDSAKYLDIPKGTRAPFVYTPYWGAICMPAPHSPQYALCIPNMDYIAHTCDPKNGHLTRALAALEACVSALEIYQHADDGAARFIKGFAAAPDTINERSPARAALAQAEELLREK